MIHNTPPLPGGIPIMLRDMRIDDVDSGLPLLTITRPEGGEPILFRLAPDAVRGLVDALVGVAEAAPGECRIVVKCDAETLAKALLAIRREGAVTTPTPTPTVVSVTPRIAALARTWGEAYEDDELNVRTRNALKRSGVLYVWQCIRWDNMQLMAVRNMGTKCVRELRRALDHLLPVSDEEIEAARLLGESGVPRSRWEYSGASADRVAAIWELS